MRHRVVVCIVIKFSTQHDRCLNLLFGYGSMIRFGHVSLQIETPHFKTTLELTWICWPGVCSLGSSLSCLQQGFRTSGMSQDDSLFQLLLFLQFSRIFAESCYFSLSPLLACSCSVSHRGGLTQTLGTSCGLFAPTLSRSAGILSYSMWGREMGLLVA